MSVRRSQRLKSQNDQGQVNIPPPAIAAQPINGKKRKAPSTTVEPRNKSKKAAIISTDKTRRETKTKNADILVPALPSSNGDLLSSLPPEILDMILHNIKDPASLSKLSKTCKRYYSLASPQLYKRISAAAMFHAHIAKLIRTLEPHLTISQAKQLKKEGTYKGQSERFSRKFDENIKPACSDHVQQLVIGVASPGKKHDYIVHRYFEEALKNMSNLEIVEAHVLTESIAQSLAGLQRLQALNLAWDNLHDDGLESLARIKNLKHLSVESCGYGRNGHDKENVIQSLLLNSRSTLQSLAMRVNPYNSDFLDDWENNGTKAGGASSHEPDFSALSSFALTGASFESNFVTSLTRAIKFVRLRELALGRLYSGRALLFEHLINLFSTAHTASTGIKLRTLSLDLSADDYDLSNVEKQAIVDAQCRLISSFDTLTSLEVQDYNQYPREVPTNPGLSNALLQAILKHENLTQLKISYAGVGSGRKIPYLSPTTVTTLVTQLRKLKEIEFAPEEDDINEMGKALARSTSLTSISLSPTPTWASISRPEEPGLELLKGIINGFLSQRNDSSTGGYKWEDYCNLQRVSVDHRVWEIASKFGKGVKGMKKAEKFVLEGDTRRQVMYREITGSLPFRIHVGYDPDFEWVEKVSNYKD